MCFHQLSCLNLLLHLNLLNFLMIPLLMMMSHQNLMMNLIHLRPTMNPHRLNLNPPKMTHQLNLNLHSLHLLLLLVKLHLDLAHQNYLLNLD